MPLSNCNRWYFRYLGEAQHCHAYAAKIPCFANSTFARQGTLFPRFLQVILPSKSAFFNLCSVFSQICRVLISLFPPVHLLFYSTFPPQLSFLHFNCLISIRGGGKSAINILKLRRDEVSSLNPRRVSLKRPSNLPPPTTNSLIHGHRKINFLRQLLKVWSIKEEGGGINWHKLHIS